MDLFVLVARSFISSIRILNFVSHIICELARWWLQSWVFIYTTTTTSTQWNDYNLKNIRRFKILYTCVSPPNFFFFFFSFFLSFYILRIYWILLLLFLVRKTLYFNHAIHHSRFAYPIFQCFHSCNFSLCRKESRPKRGTRQTTSKSN